MKTLKRLSAAALVLAMLVCLMPIGVLAEDDVIILRDAIWCNSYGADLDKSVYQNANDATVVAGALPEGISVCSEQEDWMLIGSPFELGTFDFTLAFSDDDVNVITEQAYRLNVVDIPRVDESLYAIDEDFEGELVGWTLDNWQVTENSSFHGGKKCITSTSAGTAISPVFAVRGEFINTSCVWYYKATDKFCVYVLWGDAPDNLTNSTKDPDNPVYTNYTDLEPRNGEWVPKNDMPNNPCRYGGNLAGISATLLSPHFYMRIVFENIGDSEVSIDSFSVISGYNKNYTLEKGATNTPLEEKLPTTATAAKANGYVVYPSLPDGLTLTGTPDNLILSGTPEIPDDCEFYIEFLHDESALVGDMENRILMYQIEVLDRPIGDINSNGHLDTGDVVNLLQYAVGTIEFDESYSIVADINNDGAINTGDAVVVLRYCVSLDT